MQESGQRVEAVARDGESDEQLVASRILDNPIAWTRWENEHAGLMRTVAEQRHPLRQITALKTAAFSVIHRKALFEHLRDQRIRGEARRELVGYFHRTRGYGHALIAEHGSYLRSACSYLCSSYLGSTVICDGVFQEPMRRYEELYAEYFRAFCDDSVNRSDDEIRSWRTLLPYLKYQLSWQRRAVLAMPQLTPSASWDAALRRRTGDTQKLRVDGLRAEFGG
jgi:hypothetical protein